MMKVGESGERRDDDVTMDDNVTNKRSFKDAVHQVELELSRERVKHASTSHQMTRLAETVLQLKHQLAKEKKRNKQLQTLLRDIDVDSTDSFGVVPPPPAPPPPPPPPTGSTNPSPGREGVPKPQNPMKHFNWKKITDVTELAGTIWETLDDTQVYAKINLKEFEAEFSEYQPKVKESPTDVSVPREISVVRADRARNCEIVLKTCELTMEEIRTSVLNANSDRKLQIDVIERLLKFIPKKEEMSTLEEHAGEKEKLAAPDRFLLETGRVDHYKQRLQSLYLKETFDSRVADLQPKMDTILKACRHLIESPDIKTLLQSILALGNFMNRGYLGNARGFTVASLNNLVDTKSSTSTNTTLLDYLLTFLQDKFPKTLGILDDCDDIHQAAKIDTVEIDKDIETLETGIDDIHQEISYFKEHPSTYAGDQYVPIMSKFVLRSGKQTVDLSNTFTKMTDEFDKCRKYFRNKDNGVVSMVFFGEFSKFLTSLKEARDR